MIDHKKDDEKDHKDHKKDDEKDHKPKGLDFDLEDDKSSKKKEKEVPRFIETQIDATTIARKPNPEHPDFKPKKEKKEEVEEGSNA